MTVHVSNRALIAGASAIRSVRADAADPKSILDGLQKAWAAFQEKNTAAMKDVVRQEEVQRIEASIGDLQAVVDEVNTKLAAIAQQSGGRGQDRPLPGQDADYTKAFNRYFRTGEGEHEVKAKLAAGPRAALSVGSNPDGGFTAPVEWDRQIESALKLVSPMRQICTVRTIGTQAPTRLWNQRGAASGWVGETAARPETATSTLARIQYPMGQVYAMPSATQDILDDSLIDIEAWLGDEVALEFEFQEGQAFIDGNGTNRPKGFLVYATAQTEHPAGAIAKQTIAGGAITADSLVNTAYALHSAFLPNARWVANRATHGAIRRLKDGQGQYLWQPPMALGQPATLLGYPVTELPGMPNVAVNAYPIAFGDFQRGYHIIDRMGVRILRDPYTAKPYTLFYTTKRVGGGVNNPEALRLLQVLA